jgi:hypothetical protein
LSVAEVDDELEGPQRSDLPLQIVMGEMSPFSIWETLAVLTSVRGRDLGLGQLAVRALAALSAGADQKAPTGSER